MSPAEGVGAGEVTAEVLARLTRIELRVDDLDALLAPAGGARVDDGRGGPSGPAVTVYPDLPTWVVEHFARTFTRPLGGEWRWCPRWEEHPEAVVRLEALWLSWEKLRVDPDLGMAVWLRDHLDPQLTVLLSGRGPFARCSASRHEPTEGLPVRAVHSPVTPQHDRCRKVRVPAMSDERSVPTSTACPGIDAASEALAAVLVGGPDVATSLAVSEVLDVLGDVQPPLPPLRYPEVGVDAGEGITRALAALGQAVEEASTVAEALRAGRAAHLLRDLLNPGGDGDGVGSAPGVVP